MQKILIGDWETPSGMSAELYEAERMFSGVKWH